LALGYIFKEFGAFVRSKKILEVLVFFKEEVAIFLRRVAF
jgi:hypothetical protein